MVMEAETLSMLSWVFCAVIIFSLAVIIRLWLRNKSTAFIWFIAQLTVLYFSFQRLLYVIKPKHEIPLTMLSEENSLALVVTGLLWSLSMVFMLIGVWSLNRRDKTLS